MVLQENGTFIHLTSLARDDQECKLIVPGSVCYNYINLFTCTCYLKFNTLASRAILLVIILEVKKCHNHYTNSISDLLHTMLYNQKFHEGEGAKN